MSRNSKLVAAISISMIFAFVLCGPIRSVLADSAKDEIQKQEQLSEQQAQAYLNQLGKSSGYGQFNVTSTDEKGMDRKAAITQAELAMEMQGRQYLQQVTKTVVGKLNTTTTDETGKNRNAEIAQAKLALEEQDRQYLQNTTSSYGQFNATTTDESGISRSDAIAQAEQSIGWQIQSLQQNTTSGYGQLNATSTDETGGTVNRSAEISQAELTLEEQGQQYLQHITKQIVGPPNATSTDEIGKNRSADIAKAELAMEKEAQALIAQMYPKLAQKEYGS